MLGQPPPSPDPFTLAAAFCLGLAPAAALVAEVLVAARAARRLAWPDFFAAVAFALTNGITAAIVLGGVAADAVILPPAH